MKNVVMVPTLNEKENIGLLVEAILGLNLNCHILIVDDDSPDGTGAIADDYAARCDLVHVLHRRRNRGRGYAGIAGLHYAVEMGAEKVIEMDADYSHQPQYIPLLLQGLETFDMVLGSRYIAGGRDCDRGLIRRWLSKAANWYERVLLGVSVRDCTSGYRGYRREVLAAIGLEGIMTPGPAVLSDILYRVHRHGFRIGEVPIEFIDRRRGASSLNGRILLASLGNVLRLRRYGAES